MRMIQEHVAVARGFADLRGSAVDELRFPAHALVLLIGVPGAGKTTLLRRLYADGARPTLPPRTGGIQILDSEQTRAAWRTVLQPVPYRFWRPLVHASHYVRLWAAIRRGGPVLAHDCGTRPLVRRLAGRWAGRHGLEVHLLLLDVSPEQARAGQLARGRSIPPGRFDLHCRRWSALLDEAAQRPDLLVPGARSALVLDRRTADQLRSVRFGPEPGAGPADRGSADRGSADSAPTEPQRPVERQVDDVLGDREG
ncbi:AAA family ATPase [Actinopolymorpha pittospori]